MSTEIMGKPFVLLNLFMVSLVDPAIDIRVLNHVFVLQLSFLFIVQILTLVFELKKGGLM